MPALLGVRDYAISKSTQTSPFVNKIGGYPDYFTTPPVIPNCPQCRKGMYQVVQLYCPLTQSPYHRTLHIFTCVNKLCWGKKSSWKVLREQKQEDTAVTNAKPVIIGGSADTWGTEDDDWGGNDDDEWADNNDEQSEQNDETTNTDNIDHVTVMMDNSCNLDILSSTSDELKNTITTGCGEGIKTNEPVPSPDTDEIYMEDMPSLSEEQLSRMQSLISPSSINTSDGQLHRPKTNEAYLKAYYLNVFEDSSADTDTAPHIQQLIKDYCDKEGKAYHKMIAATGSGKSGSGSSENYEKADVKHGNITFYKFHKAVSQWPEQCVRYEFGGTSLPLLSEILKPEVCSYCGNERQFELQLMPNLVGALQLTDSEDCAVEFGTVLIFTCSQSCWDDNSGLPREEDCIVQCERENYLL